MKIVIICLLSIAATLLAVSAVPAFRAQTQAAVSGSQCDTPILYKLGTVDPKFLLSQTQVLEDITKATEVWNNAYSKPLFFYSDTAPLTIHLVYDERAALDSQIDEMQTQLDQKNKTLQQQIDTYQKEVTSFRQRLADFNAKVDGYNHNGGVAPDVYEELTREQNDLNAQGDALNARARALNLSTHNYNSNVKELNQDVGKFNQAIAQKPEEGLYDPNTGTITIYFATNQSELIHTLAHELGHAMGMIHVADPKGIMYTSGTSSLTPGSEDRIQLNHVCRTQFLPVIWTKRLITWTHSTVQPIINRIEEDFDK